MELRGFDIPNARKMCSGRNVFSISGFGIRALVVIGLLASTAAAQQLAVTLAPSVESPAPAGTLITWTAAVSGVDSGTFRYRFVIQDVDQTRRVVKDFGPDNTFDWSPVDHEGSYGVEVTVKNRDTGETATAVAAYNVLPVATSQPVVTPTSHPLVFLYSAPPCPNGATMTVLFLSPDNRSQQTPAKTCDGVTTMNFYLAGLLPQSVYSAKHVIRTSSSSVDGPLLLFTSGALPDGLPVYKSTGTSLAPAQGLLLAASLFTNFVATDLKGNVLWYYPNLVTFLTRPVAGGNFLAINEDAAGDQSRQILREFDLAGITIMETNAERVSEQLVALGKRPISAFHHDARRLPDGRTLVLAAVEEIMSGVQDDGPVDILGDMIILLDRDLNVIWTWDAFDRLDVSRKATLGDQCSPGACPPLFAAPAANDWLHGNALAVTPDGNLLYSARNQDWVVKIGFQNGTGSGDVLWRLGQDGDFAIRSADPQPWFSHQHEPEFESDGSLSLFDNSLARQSADRGAHSRGQVYRLDEQNLTANQVMNADLGDYGFVVGSAQRLDSGGYSFDVGFKLDGSSVTREVDPAGNIVYSLAGSSPAYRTFRVRDLYTAY